MPEISLVSVIDDSESVRWAVARVVRSAGFGVELFTSSEEFLRSNQKLNTACLVVDVQLPGMSGLQLQSHLAAAGRHIPIIFMTASEDQKARAQAVKAGAVDVLDKTSGDKALLKEIRLILKPSDKDGGTNLHTSGRSC